MSSWLENDSEQTAAPVRVNWGAIYGIALSLTVSAAFWAGMGLLVERFLR